MFIQHVRSPRDPHLPTRACCRWLGLCICHARQTFGGGSVGGGGLFTRITPPKTQLCSDVFVHAFFLTAETSLCPVLLSPPGF